MGRPKKKSSPPPSGAVSIPFNYRPRLYQLPLLQALDTGKKRGVVVGRKILWDGMDRDGFRFIDHFPSSLIASTNEAEMQITLTNGSVFQIIGTDKMDKIVGTNEEIRVRPRTLIRNKIIRNEIPLLHSLVKSFIEATTSLPVS